MSNERIMREKIMLPVTKDNQPDYAFMKYYMLQKEGKKIKQYQSYIANRLTKLTNLVIKNY